MSSKRSWAIIGGIIRSISRPGRWTSTLLSLPISLVTLSRMRGGFYSRPRNGAKIRAGPMRWRSAVLLQLLLAPSLFAVSPRISYERVHPAAHDLGRARNLAIVHVVGDSDATDAFVEHFLDQVNHSGFLQARDARDATGPADAYLAVRTFSCETFN